MPGYDILVSSTHQGMRPGDFFFFWSHDSPGYYIPGCLTLRSMISRHGELDLLGYHTPGSHVLTDFFIDSLGYDTLASHASLQHF